MHVPLVSGLSPLVSPADLTQSSGFCIIMLPRMKDGNDMHFVLLDDITSHNDILEAKLTALCARKGWDGQVVLKTTNPKQVIRHANCTKEPTVYFLDIRLSETENTLSLFRQLRMSEQECYLIYVSAHPQFAMDCLHTHAFDFLLKPLMDEQLEDCMNALWRIHSSRCAEELLQINMGGRMLRIRQRDIVCCTRETMNVRVYCTDGSSYVWRESFEHLLPRLNSHVFFQSHRSHIINVLHIKEAHWGEDKLLLSNGMELTVSRRRVAALKVRLQVQEGSL